MKSTDGKRQAKHRRKIFNQVKGLGKPWIYPASVFYYGKISLCLDHRETLHRDVVLDRATPKWADPEKIAVIYVTARKEGKHVDHIIPLRGKTVSGLHVETNLQIISKDLNLWKSNKLFESHSNGY
jgi:hypothetical protein